MERLVSLLGLFVMVGLAWLMSSGRRRLDLRVIAGGALLQFALALLILRTDAGRQLFERIGRFIRTLLGFVDEGVDFVFGAGAHESSLAFAILPTIVFFSALMSVLYHLGVMQLVIRCVAVVMQRTLNTSGAESLAAAANIFVGHTEAPLVVRPYLEEMTRSELMALMVGGFATVAGGVLAAYIKMGVDATHLLTASVISAPAALLIAKVMIPETEVPRTRGRVEVRVERESVNVLHAVSTGTTVGVRLAINVGAMLVIFVALIYMVNGFIGLFSDELTLEKILGWAFAPFAWLMGVEWRDSTDVGQLLGIKTVLNEFLAYEELGSMSGLSERSRVIATYALCGFANFGSIGIQLGGLGPLIPERLGEVARLALRAMVGGTLAGFMTACIAGILI